MKNMRVGIFGMGYVGLTTSACLLEEGVQVCGYEFAPEKLARLREGFCPITEPGVAEVIAQGQQSGAFSVGASLGELPLPDIVLVCVGTPVNADGVCNLAALRSVLSELEDRFCSATPEAAPEIVIRSTLPPGTLRSLSGEFPRLFAATPVCFYPEFLREGTAMSDFRKPPLTVIGLLDPDRRPRLLENLLRGLGFEPLIYDATCGEILKVASNAFHALKVCFANEVARVASALGTDGRAVMELFVRDTDLNISRRYLLPGAPYGGSCLPKDTRMFASVARDHGLVLDIVTAVERSTQAHMGFLVKRLQETGCKSFGILGLSFKIGTDDVRESPTIKLVEHLREHTGTVIHIHDFCVNEETAVGVNRDVLTAMLRTGGVRTLADIPELLALSECVVVMHSDPRYNLALEHFKGTVCDVARGRFP